MISNSQNMPFNSIGIKMVSMMSAFLTMLLIVQCTFSTNSNKALCENTSLYINAYLGSSTDNSHYFLVTKYAEGETYKHIVGYSKSLETTDVRLPNLDIHSFMAHKDMIILVDTKSNLYKYKFRAIALEGPFPNDCISLDVRGKLQAFLRSDGLYLGTDAEAPQKIGEYPADETTRVFMLSDERIALHTPSKALTVVRLTGEVESIFHGLDDMSRLAPDIYCVSVKNDTEGKKAIEAMIGKSENGVAHIDCTYFPITVSNNAIVAIKDDILDLSIGTPCIKSGATIRLHSEKVFDRKPVDCIPQRNIYLSRICKQKPEDIIDVSLDVEKCIFTERLFWIAEQDTLRPFAIPICINQNPDQTYCILFADGTWQITDNDNRVIKTLNIDSAYRMIDRVFPHGKYIYWQNGDKLYRVDNHGHVEMTRAIIQMDSKGEANIYYMHNTNLVALNMLGASKSAMVYDYDSLFKSFINIDRPELMIPKDPKYPLTKHTYLTKRGLVCFDNTRNVIMLCNKYEVIHSAKIELGRLAVTAGLCNVVIICDSEKMIAYDSLQNRVVFNKIMLSNHPSKIEYINNGILISDSKKICYVYESDGQTCLKQIDILADSFSTGYFNENDGQLTLFDWRGKAISKVTVSDAYEVIAIGER